MSVAAGVATVREKLLKGNTGQTKVHRYWPGRRPNYATEQVDHDDDDNVTMVDTLVEEPRREEVPADTAAAAAKDDPRLRRLAESRRNREEAIARHREIRKAEIVSTKVEVDEDEESRKLQIQLEGVTIKTEDNDEDDAALEDRRRRNRERILQKQREEEAAAAAAAAAAQEEEEEEAEEDDDEEEVSEYETDSDDDALAKPMVKPVFVRKAERETIAERERLEAEELALQEAMQRKLEERKLESKQMLIEVLKKEKEAEKSKMDEFEGSDVDTDEENPAEEYEAWKAREIARIKRDREEKETALREKMEREKLNEMDEEERLDYHKNNPKPAPPPKKKQGYLQKFYHKGVFYQSEDSAKVIGGLEIFKRDYSAPTGEDKQDKSLLPKVMQVKQFGRSGRTKWTHLVQEDTTKWDSPWTSNDIIRNHYTAKMAGLKPIPNPSRKRTAEQANL